ncbi:hypothetical protein BO85DRAFT_495426 [Aspergillus piperis CBS 112811]|uniref:Zn(2)-C6 fungal-type domain-containing protein n=1 Tax=Aspergillus piperis CBS 112811 TaxID=1448313 RepID=A0A8G1RC76_9EURO|nr:hypothetical protein BO85DRAFT_495426 [Aspergillus piperis CBS 112811]RAH63519.1 hypothetical protein BO85DRAFT_495426 [Aspergillus piperis CBS 112811]
MEAPDSEAATSQVKVKWKRTRSGCLKCRRRRRKCDGARPHCRNCQVRGTTCQWGLRALFHHSRNLKLSHSEFASLCPGGRQHDSSPVPTQGVMRIIDESNSIASQYHVLRDTYAFNSDLDQSDAVDGSEKNDNDVLNEDKSIMNSPAAPTTLTTYSSRSDGGASTPDIPYFHLQESSTSRATGTEVKLTPSYLSVSDLCQSSTELAPSLQPVVREYTFSPFSNTHHYPPHGTHSIVTNTTETFIPPFSLGLGVSQDQPRPPEPFLPVSSSEKARLLSSYIKETGTWCETTDSNMHFTMRSLHSMAESAAFVAAAMSLASRQQDHVAKVQRPVTLELYQYTIKHLLQQDPATAGVAILATCTLLCVYEMMASSVHDWRRHLKGCAGLLLAKKWNGSSQGIVKSCFWAFARIDIWAAFISGKTTLIPADFWLDDTSIQSAMQKDVDDYCNLAIFIFAQIINMFAEPKFGTREARPTYTVSVSKLWGKLQAWYRLRPREVCPLLRATCSPPKVFPDIIYTSSSASESLTFSFYKSSF